MMSMNKVPVLCRFGGDFIWESNKVYYRGGTNRIVHVDRAIDYLNLLFKVHEIYKLTDVSSIKYKYPTLDLDSLVSIENDEDLSNMMEAFPRSSEPINLYVFGDQNLSIPIPIPSNVMRNADTGNVQASLQDLRGSNTTVAPSSHNTSANDSGVPNASNGLRETGCLLMDSCVSDMPKMMLVLKEGQEFVDANAFHKALREYAIRSKFEYKRTRFGGGHYQAKCIKGNCSWRIHAYKLPDKPTFKIKSLKGNHTCNVVNESTMPNTTTHRQASRSWIAALVKDRLQKNLRCRPKDIVNEISREYGIKVSYDKAWRGKQFALKEMQCEQSIKTLTMTHEEIQTTNPGGMAKLSSIDEPFKDVIYPKGDLDAVSISKRDVELLQPKKFINDTIIDFYLKYLKNKIPVEDKQRFHFFNCFFFCKLADIDKDPGSAREGSAAFLNVRKWTGKVNVFEKDYIFIPVNFTNHWSLIVICHPGEVANFKDEEIEKAPKVPCILHMDSWKGIHKGLENLIRRYLWEEWNHRPESFKDVSLKFSNLRFVSPELPQQENPFDCGLFLLHYVELFLKEAPVNLNPFKIKFSKFLNVDWFPPFEASHKRFVIQKLIFELSNDQSLESPPAASSSQHGSPKFQENTFWTLIKPVGISQSSQEAQGRC
ncbi:probable ubiquitin-like-specific protease 2A isoform X2 [Magnolia sinica]|uniref:probable ubiquitin-like-specific protease 2A isoform X2 n=1 Tax=Magnolia sinica TaxID=86752 RepID=UPI002658A4BF|nr:probable ubiquitin-like-specific protease 2A isoform X2 [Magnolia sinica]